MRSRKGRVAYVVALSCGVTDMELHDISVQLLRDHQENQYRKENMNEKPVINVGLTINDIKYAAAVIHKDVTLKREEKVFTCQIEPIEATLAKFEEVIEAHEYVEKRQAKRKKEAEAQEREAKAVELLSRGGGSAKAAVIPDWLVDLVNQEKGGCNGYCR